MEAQNHELGVCCKRTLFAAVVTGPIAVGCPT